MKISRRELLAAGVASVVVGKSGTETQALEELRSISQSRAAAPQRSQSPHAPNLPIRDYLSREARRITENALADLRTPADFKRRIPEKRRQNMDMMGLADLPAPQDRPVVPYKVTGVVERPTYRIEKLHNSDQPGPAARDGVRAEDRRGGCCPLAEQRPGRTVLWCPSRSRALQTG